MIDDDGIPCIAHGVRREEHGETAVRWVLFDRATLEAEHGPVEAWDNDTLAWVSGMAASYGGPGRWFWHAPYERVGRTRILVKQRGGYDI